MTGEHVPMLGRPIAKQHRMPLKQEPTAVVSRIGTNLTTYLLQVPDPLRQMTGTPGRHVRIQPLKKRHTLQNLAQAIPGRPQRILGEQQMDGPLQG